MLFSKSVQNQRPLHSVLVVAEVCNCLSLQVTIQGSVEVVFLSVLFSKSMQKRRPLLSVLVVFLSVLFAKAMQNLRPLLGVLVVTEVCNCLSSQIPIKGIR